MPGIGSDPCPPGAAAGLRSVLQATEEFLHSEQAWPQGPEETGSGTDTVALGTRVWAVSLLPWGRRALITPLCVCVSSRWGEGLHSVPGPRSSLEPGDIGHCPPPFLGCSTCLPGDMPDPRALCMGDPVLCGTGCVAPIWLLG